MKLVIAFLMSALVTVSVPVLVKNCYGRSFLETRYNMLSVLNPITVTRAYASLLDSINKLCVPTVEKKYVVHKWQDAAGAWHYTDASQDVTETENGNLPIDPNLYRGDGVDQPKVAAWLPYAILGFCFSLCGIFYLLITGIQAGLLFLRREEEEAETTVYHERQTAGEAVEFFSTSPYEVLGVSTKASFEEVEAAYERQLSRYHKMEQNNGNKANTKMVDDRYQKLLLLHQAYEAIKRKRDDKFLASA